MAFRRSLMNRMALVAWVAGLSGVGIADAHGIWFSQRATQTALIYGVGADDLDAVKRQPLVERIDGYDEVGETVPTQLRVAGPLLLVDTESPARPCRSYRSAKSPLCSTSR